MLLGFVRGRLDAGDDMRTVVPSQLVPMPRGLRQYVRETMSAIGFREIGRRRAVGLAMLVGAGAFAGMIALVIAKAPGVLWFAVLFAGLLLAMWLPTLLSSGRFRGPENLELRVRAHRDGPRLVLELAADAQGLGETLELPETAWCDADRLLRRGRPDLSGEIVALAARVVLANRGRSLFEMLPVRKRLAAWGLRLLGATAGALRSRGLDVRTRVRTLPGPYALFVPALSMALAYIALEAVLPAIKDGLAGAIVGTMLASLVATWLGGTPGRGLEAWSAEGVRGFKDGVDDLRYRFVLKRGKEERAASFRIADAMDEAGAIRAPEVVGAAVARVLHAVEAPVGR